MFNFRFLFFVCFNLLWENFCDFLSFVLSVFFPSETHLNFQKQSNGPNRLFTFKSVLILNFEALRSFFLIKLSFNMVSVIVICTFIFVRNVLFFLFLSIFCLIGDSALALQCIVMIRYRFCGPENLTIFKNDNGNNGHSMWPQRNLFGLVHYLNECYFLTDTIVFDSSFAGIATIINLDKKKTFC